MCLVSIISWAQTHWDLTSACIQQCVQQTPQLTAYATAVGIRRLCSKKRKTPRLCVCMAVPETTLGKEKKRNAEFLHGSPSTAGNKNKMHKIWQTTPSPNIGISHQRPNKLSLATASSLHLHVKLRIDALFLQFRKFLLAQPADIVL